MSKLEDIVIAFGHEDVRGRYALKSAIKALMLELIGENEPLDGKPPQYTMTLTNEIRNDFKTHLRKKVEEL